MLCSYSLDTRFGSPLGLPFLSTNGLFGEILGSIIGAGSSVAQAEASRYAAKQTANASRYAADKAAEAQDRVNSTNIYLAKQQQDFSYRMVQEQNAYNSPAAQVARYKAAGLNPYAAMAQGSISSGMQSETPSYNTPEVSAQGYIQGAQMIMQGMQTAAQQRMEGIQMAIDAGVKVAGVIQQGATAAKTRAETQFMKDSWNVNLESLKMQLNGYYLDNVRKKIDNDTASLQLSIQQTYGMKLTAVQLENAWEDYRNKVADTGLKGKQVEKLDAEIDSIAADVSLKFAQKLNVDADTESKEIQNGIQRAIKSYLSLSALKMRQKLVVIKLLSLNRNLLLLILTLKLLVNTRMLTPLVLLLVNGLVLLSKFQAFSLTLKYYAL